MLGLRMIQGETLVIDIVLTWSSLEFQV